MLYMSDTNKKRGALNPEHLASLEEGRRLGRTVRQYLDHLEHSRPKRGRKRTSETVKSQLAGCEQDLVDATGLEKVLLTQRRMDLEAELHRLEQTTDIGPLEDEFVKVAAAYSKAKGISYAAWREAGVSASVLKRAGVGSNTP